MSAQLMHCKQQPNKSGVGVDIMELPQMVNGNRYVISFVDYLTKWVESFPSDNQTSETIVRLLIGHVICRHGVDEALHI